MGYVYITVQQLAQTEAALVDCTDAMTKLHLYALQEDLLQLISLTKESLSALNPASESSEDNTVIFTICLFIISVII